MKPSEIARFVARKVWAAKPPIKLADGLFLSEGSPRDPRPGIIIVAEASRIASAALEAADRCGYLEWVFKRANRFTGPCAYADVPDPSEASAIVWAREMEIVEVLIANQELRELVSDYIHIPVHEKDVAAVLKGSEFLNHFNTVLQEG